MKSAVKDIVFLSCLFILICGNVGAVESKFKVSDIPAELLKDAKAVIRNSEIVFEITDINKAVRRVTYVITVLNENGIDNSVLTEYYDKFLTVGKIKHDLYDRNGSPIRNRANVQLEDYSANRGYSLYEDNRIKVLDPKWRNTPFTVEYSYEETFHGLLNYPVWYLYNDFNISVEKSTFTIIVPAGFKFRYLEKNMDHKCEISDLKDKTKYSWHYEKMPAVKNEPFSKSVEEYLPVVISAPSDFEIDGYTGNMDSWANFGKWVYSLGKGRNTLDQTTTDKVLEMVSGLSGDFDKISVLYNYLQNKVRYVSIQKGIGSWQPIEADDVDRLSYGDCKALSNYMKSLLDIAGIKSFYTLVRSGESSPAVTSGFPSNQFNHAILCIPTRKDTVWLECTSQHIPCGYLGTFTDDRKVLLINEDGGTLVRTKKYSLEDNKQIRIGSVSIDSDGNGTSSSQTDYCGILYDRISGILQMDETDKKKFILSKIPVHGFNLLRYSYVEERSIIPKIRETLDGRYSGIGIIMGNRMIVKPNIMARIDEIPYRTKERKSDIQIRRGYIYIDTISFSIPPGYKIENAPDKLMVDTGFGSYSTEIISDTGGFKYIRTFKVYKGNYPVTDYPDFVDFFEKISLADENKLILIRDI